MKNKQEKVHTIGFSLVSKLNIQLWFRLVGTFIMLNLVFLAASGITLGVLGERRAAQAVQQIQAFGLPASAESAWLSSQGLEIRAQDGSSQGILLPAQIRRVFPQETRDARRMIRLPHEPDAPLYNILDNLQYHFQLEVDGTPVTIVIHFASAIWVLKTVFLVLLIWRLVTAVRTLISRAELIRRVLKPSPIWLSRPALCPRRKVRCPWKKCRPSRARWMKSTPRV